MIALAWIVLALVHAPPALATFSPQLRQRMYGVSEDATLGVILTHRGILFLAVAVSCIYAVFENDGRRLASIVAGISMLGFLALYALAKLPKGRMRAIALMDALALPALAFALIDAWGL